MVLQKMQIYKIWKNLPEYVMMFWNLRGLSGGFTGGSTAGVRLPPEKDRKYSKLYEKSLTKSVAENIIRMILLSKAVPADR